ncbi:MAG: tRNA glutamyl-Q(34) synthetase GluQRS [Myxococcales bacterium]|nr:tRNA glutamyl-Q(34) synthetase GluQRS [Myxococcales bacterium]
MVTRFAPSPTGFLHLGHAYSARMGFDAARAEHGRFLVRIEDIDRTRCRPLFVDAILSDLQFLGLSWDGEVRRQSEHLADYERALAQLDELGVLYPCFCTRAEIAEEIAAAQSAPQQEPGSDSPPRYPGRCKRLDPALVAKRISDGNGYALRLHTEQVQAILSAKGMWPLTFRDRHHGVVPVDPQLLGDVVLARKELKTSYHLAVVVDDHLQGVTLVTRGADLLSSTHVHRQLQALLSLTEPAYSHHPLLTDPDGSRLAKRRGSESIRSLREKGLTADELWAKVGLRSPAVL